MSRRRHECKGSAIPVTLTAALLLHGLGISIGVAVFGEVARETFFREGGTIGDGTVVAVVSFVGTSHWRGQWSVKAAVKGHRGLTGLVRGEEDGVKAVSSSVMIRESTWWSIVAVVRVRVSQMKLE